MDWFEWFLDEKNREAALAILAIATAIVVGFWALYKHFTKKDSGGGTTTTIIGGGTVTAGSGTTVSTGAGSAVAINQSPAIPAGSNVWSMY